MFGGTHVMDQERRQIFGEASNTIHCTEFLQGRTHRHRPIRDAIPDERRPVGVEARDSGLSATNEARVEPVVTDINGSGLRVAGPHVFANRFTMNWNTILSVLNALIKTTYNTATLSTYRFLKGYPRYRRYIKYSRYSWVRTGAQLAQDLLMAYLLSVMVRVTPEVETRVKRE
ncbi:hypothetical protein K438DRAFT_1779374 [Mycena galopus ATCC 62051]|nr:hypothetical protein K438DRAFT_1779374 [Mycena galopus ATCC 62051]